MRFKSLQVGGYQIFAVTGTNTVSFAIDFTNADTQGLLGFAVERHDPEEDEQYFLYGFKVFQSVITNPSPDLVVSTRDHPIQSFVYDDFTAKPGRKYTYYFHPVKGKPKNLDRSSSPIPITVQTEPNFSTLEHDIFFNRGVASSQAYQRRFGNQSPEQLTNAGDIEKAQAALDWRTMMKIWLLFGETIGSLIFTLLNLTVCFFIIIFAQSKPNGILSDAH
jgi:hypothetical protein